MSRAELEVTPTEAQVRQADDTAQIVRERLELGRGIADSHIRGLLASYNLMRASARRQARRLLGLQHDLTATRYALDTVLAAAFGDEAAAERIPALVTALAQQPSAGTPAPQGEGA